MRPPTLHVIYAGRGDAMILECDDRSDPNKRNFILVDGGPRHHDAIITTRTAPYHRYLASACKDIMKDSKFACIIFSHPDEDHYHGYLHAYANQEIQIPFTDTVFLPNVKSDTDTSNAPIDDVCTLAGMAKTVLHPQNGAENYLIAPVRALYPARQKIVLYNGKENRLTGDDLQFIDEKITKNERSILMYTASGSTDEMGIFFTGDNKVNIISEFMRSVFSPKPNPRMAIYKMQHHGSLPDNEINLCKLGFTGQAMAVGLIYYLLKVRLRTAHMPFGKAVQTVAIAAADHLWDSIIQPHKVAKYFARLESIMKELQTSRIKDLTHPPDPGYVFPVWLDSKYMTFTDPEKHFKDLNEALSGSMFLAGWESFLNNHANEEYMTYAHVRGVYRFYSSFSSDVYVVSANYRHKHPRSEVLVGLALAVRDQKRRARLYVTSGKSLDIDSITKVVDVVSDGNVQQLFSGDHLRVSYLSRRSYMSLTGISQGQQSQEQWTDRDIDNVTEEIKIAGPNDQRQHRAELDVWLEQADSDKLLITKEYHLRFPAEEDSWRYVYLDRNAEGFFWAVAEKDNPRSTWVDTKDARIRKRGAFEVRCRTERFSFPSRFFRFEYRRTHKRINYHYVVDKENDYVLCHVMKGEMEFQPLEPDSNLVLVNFGPAPSGFQKEINHGKWNLYGSHVETTLPPQLNVSVGALTSSSQHPLHQAFEFVNDPLKDKTNPNIIETLGRLFGDKSMLIAAVQRLPEAFVNAGFGRFEVDLDHSTAVIDSHPLDGEIITSAVLYLLKYEGKVEPREIVMAGLSFQLSNIIVKVDGCHSPQVHLTVSSQATLKSKGLKLNMTWKSSETETIISFNSTTIALKDLIASLFDKDFDPERILKGDIPLIEKSSTDDPVPSMRNMPGPVHEVGFSLSQPFDLIDNYDLADIWVRTESLDWKKFLPIPEKSKAVKSEVLLKILNPLHPKASRIATSVKLAIPVPSNRQNTISALFDAIPLTRVGDYDYQFRIASAGDRVTIPDIVDIIGLTGVSDKVKSIPLLSNVFNSVRVHEAGLSVERVQGKWEFREWDFDLYIPVFHLIPGTLSLTDTLVKVESFGKEEIQIKGEATFRSEKLQKEAKVSIGLPTDKELGYIVMSSPDSLTFSDIFSIFGLGDLPVVPFLTGSTALRLSYCDAKFRKPKEGSITMLSSTAKLQAKGLVVELFEMQDIELSLSWQRGGEPKAKSTTSFELSALLLKIKSLIKVTFDGGKKELTAYLTPITGSPMKVVDVLGFLISGVDSPLHSALGSLEIKIVEMSLDLSTGSPSSFKLEMRDDATLQLPSATDTEHLTVGSITLEYSKVASKLDVFAALMVGGAQTNIRLTTFTNSTTKERSVEFGIVLQKGQKELGLMALLEAVGIDNIDIPRPEGCPEFTIGMANIKGKFVDKDKSGLKFAQLGVHIEMARVLMSDWDMSMDYIYVDVDYNKARTEKPLSVLVSGMLSVAGSVEMTINYIDEKDALEMDAELHLIREEEVKVKSILEWLAGDSIEDSLPTFISEAVIDLKKSKFGVSLSRHKGEGSSVIATSLSFTLGSVTVQLARTRIRPDGSKKDDKLPWKTMLKLAVDTLPRPPPLPLVGQMEQPFSTQVYWTNSDISLEEVERLNSLATFKNQQLLLSNHATEASAFGQGLSFMLLENGDVILASKPAKSKMTVSAEKGENPEAQEMRKVNKRVNGVNITNIGIDYDAKGQSIKVKFTARMTVGPLDGELINFSMSVKLPRGEKIDLSDWKNLDIEMGLDGLSLAMTGSNLNVAGTLHRIKIEGDDISMAGFEGGVSVKLKKYQFVGFGSYKSVKIQQEDFVSLMGYAMLKGPMLKTGLVELTSISGGFGLGSKLEIPAITEIHKFPLLLSPVTDPMIMFERLRGTDGAKYMTETNGANWVAAGVTGTACELIDVQAVLTTPLDPSTGGLAIMGIASAHFPRDAEPGKALAAIKINFQGSIDMSRGFLLFEGRIAEGSFILFDDCVLTGGFAVGAWFGTSPQAGDWCISIGGWHPAYQPPSHYPGAPPRMRLQWSYGDNKQLSLDGQAYAAVTPDALMAGLAVSANYKSGRCGAHFDFRVDLILWMHPIYYDARFFISAGLSYEANALIITVPLKIILCAELYINGPPFGGEVFFNWTVVSFRVKFGEPQDKGLRKLDFNEFLDVVLRKSEKYHVLCLESGAIAPSKAPNVPQTPNSAWVVRGGSFAFSVTSRVPTKQINFSSALDPERKFNGSILARPMQLSARLSGLTANMEVSIIKMSELSDEKVKDFTFEPISEQLPASLWGSFDGNANGMLGGTSRESTVSHIIGLRIQAPMARWSSQNPQIIQSEKLAQPEPIPASFNDDTTRDNGLDAKPRADGGNVEEDFDNAREALTGSDKREEELEAVKKRNARRSYIIGQWMAVRKLKTPASLKSDVPLRYAKGLAHFSHVAPKVSLE
ncbi:hypothetical protein FACUT_1270 [Fusarium acutatum]|uniref:DUF6603 domain-containing protein n=1 Tax=Fusarium acutatum TaxID=78861 RepID=A0A8H4K679_9HYPO|nr:hypothetical protein FACUT_1270 [Fusarium acutatum]